MIVKLMNGGANGVLVVALSGALSNPIPRRESSARVLSPTGTERRTAA